MLTLAGGHELHVKLPYQLQDGEWKRAGFFPKESSSPVAIGLAAAGTVAFAEVHAEQVGATGGAAPKNEQTAYQFKKPAHHLWSKANPGNLRSQDGIEIKLLIDSVE